MASKRTAPCVSLMTMASREGKDSAARGARIGFRSAFVAAIGNWRTFELFFFWFCDTFISTSRSLRTVGVKAGAIAYRRCTRLSVSNYNRFAVQRGTNRFNLVHLLHVCASLRQAYYTVWIVARQPHKYNLYCASPRLLYHTTRLVLNVEPADLYSISRKANWPRPGGFNQHRRALGARRGRRAGDDRSRAQDT